MKMNSIDMNMAMKHLFKKIAKLLLQNPVFEMQLTNPFFKGQVNQNL